MSSEESQDDEDDEESRSSHKLSGSETTASDVPPGKCKHKHHKKKRSFSPCPLWYGEWRESFRRQDSYILHRPTNLATHILQHAEVSKMLVILIGGRAM